MEVLSALASMDRMDKRKSLESPDLHEGFSKVGSSPEVNNIRPSILDLGMLSQQKAAQGAMNNPMSLHNPSSALNVHSAILASRIAEDQDRLAAAAYLQQRQQASLALQLGQIRRLQAASLLYGSGAPAPTSSSLHHLDSLLAARQSQMAAASDLVQAQQLLQSHLTAGGVLPPPASLPSTSGSIHSLLARSSKLGPDGFLKLGSDNYLNGGLMKEQSLEENQHVAKKARTSLQSSAVTDLDRPPADSGVDEEALLEAEEEKNGHRFRAYQFEQWTEKFQELCDFRKVKGHCQVPHTYQDNPSLARWVKRQRYQYKLKAENKMSTMTDQRAKLLEDIGFIWDSHAAAWAEKLHELKDYAVLKGNCNVPSTYPENPQLATWVKCQRRQYKLLRDKRTSNMTVDRVRELEKIGFAWEVRKSGDREYR